MSEQFLFDDKEAFLEKLRELVEGGIGADRLHVRMPYPVHEVDGILRIKGSRLWMITAPAAVAGLAAGYAFTGYTVWDWPLITGGKPLFSVPPFTIISFELLILFGSVVSLLGYLALARQPSLKNILNPEEFGNRFAILVEDRK